MQSAPEIEKTILWIWQCVISIKSLQWAMMISIIGCDLLGYYAIPKSVIRAVPQWPMTITIGPGSVIGVAVEQVQPHKRSPKKELRYRRNSLNNFFPIKNKSFFDKTHISTKETFELSYYWCRNYGTMENKAYETGISHASIVQYEQYYRDICSEYYQRNKPVIGGPGTVVQVALLRAMLAPINLRLTRHW